MGRGTNNNQLKAIRGSKRNGCGRGSGDGGKGDVNNDSNRYGDGDSNDTDPDSLRTPPKSIKIKNHHNSKTC
jgi:hypothetical protein